jgi:N-acetylneuraminate synthase/N,N'-diacetyllegionaminate synthase
MKNINLGSRIIGEQDPCFIAAEIGINHNGDMALAKKTIDLAVKAGVDAVKFQNYNTDDFIWNQSLEYSYFSQGKKISESQYAMFKRYELSFEQLRQLKEYCDFKKIFFFSTPTNLHGIQDLKKMNVPLLKNGSDYLTHLPLIKGMACSDIPTILSTGMATVEEIDDAVGAYKKAGGEKFVLLHCTSSYPTAPNEVNLRRIPLIRENYNCLVGFSDHTAGIIASIGAVIMGACFIEKHFTLDKELPGPDHSFSADFEEMKNLVQAVRTAEDNLGTSKIGPTDSEILSRMDFRLSCAANKDIPNGEVISERDVAFYRPGTGLTPKNIDKIIGRKINKNIAKGHILQKEDLV